MKGMKEGESNLFSDYVHFTLGCFDFVASLHVILEMFRVILESQKGWWDLDWVGNSEYFRLNKEWNLWRNWAKVHIPKMDLSLEFTIKKDARQLFLGCLSLFITWIDRHTWPITFTLMPIWRFSLLPLNSIYYGVGTYIYMRNIHHFIYTSFFERLIYLKHDANHENK